MKFNQIGLTNRNKYENLNKLNIKFYFCLLFTGTINGLEPDFLYPLENVTIPQGRDASFTCVVNNLGGYRVSQNTASASDGAFTRVCIFIFYLFFLTKQKKA